MNVENWEKASGFKVDTPEFNNWLAKRTRKMCISWFNNVSKNSIDFHHKNKNNYKLPKELTNLIDSRSKKAMKDAIMLYRKTV